MSTEKRRYTRKRPVIDLSTVIHQTREEELEYIMNRNSWRQKNNNYLPTPEEIEIEKAIIREENKERDRLKREEQETEELKRTGRTFVTVNTYKLDPSGMGGRRGKLI